MAHAFNSSTPEAEARGSLSLKLSQFTQEVPASQPIESCLKKTNELGTFNLSTWEVEGVPAWSTENSKTIKDTEKKLCLEKTKSKDKNIKTTKKHKVIMTKLHICYTIRTLWKGCLTAKNSYINYRLFQYTT